MILGTAGHVDHGKTALVRALTGVDTDRLAEERRRGLTIELGFAPLVLPDGRQISLVDVPGHEKFIPTMLSGCAGMDLVLLVVAADEGVMAQTREHLGILSLLGVRGGILVLTKADLVSPPRLAEAEGQLRAAVAGTFLAGAPAVTVSSRTGAGLDTLRAELASLLDRTPPPPAGGPFCLHVDRAFSVDGSGTVVTGTLTGGPLRRGDLVELYPGGRQSRVRALQCHGLPAEVLPPGSRAAVNLAGVKAGAVVRGDTLAPPGALVRTDRIDVSLSLLPGAPFSVKNNSQLHLHLGARSLVCRCILLGRDMLEPGERGFAQLRLSAPVAARPGMRYVVRFFSPLATVGGGVLLDLEPPLRGRNDPDRRAGLEVLVSGSEAQRVAWVLQSTNLPVERAVLARSARVAPDRLPALAAAAGAVEAGGLYLSPQGLEHLTEQARARLAEHPGLTRGALEIPPPLLPLLFRRLELYEEAGRLYLPQDRPLPQDHTEAVLEELYRAAGRTPPSNAELEAAFPDGPALCRRANRILVRRGMLIPLSPQYRIHRASYSAALEELRARFGRSPFTLAQARDALGVSRKYALLLLEYWDQNRITKRLDTTRIFL